MSALIIEKGDVVTVMGMVGRWEVTAVLPNMVAARRTTKKGTARAFSREVISEVFAKNKNERQAYGKR